MVGFDGTRVIRLRNHKAKEGYYLHAGWANKVGEYPKSVRNPCNREPARQAAVLITWHWPGTPAALKGYSGLAFVG